VADLGLRTPVALGFEAPLFIPRPASAEQLNRQRAGERGRPWCAGAGTGALALGLQQSAYVFDRIAQHARPRVTFDLEAIERGDADLLAWEAFVSGKAKNRAAEDTWTMLGWPSVARHRTGVVSDVTDQPRGGEPRVHILSCTTVIGRLMGAALPRAAQ
jgi:hypothetical protein